MNSGDEEDTTKCDSDDVGEEAPAAAPAAPNAQPAANIGTELGHLIRNIEGLRASISVSMIFAGATLRAAARQFNSYLEAHATRTGDANGDAEYELPPERAFGATKLRREIERRERAVRVLPRSFFVSLVSQYDAFLGRLLRRVFLQKPELLNASQRQITLPELLSFPSLDAAREFFLEKEIEGVLRDSHSGQFDWMERRFGLELRKGLRLWPRFIEITERRNLFVHTDGAVSTQYLDVCSKHGASVPPDLKPGDQVEVTPEYFFDSSEVIYELATKLSQVLWRKLFPEDLAAADESLIDVSYELLHDEQYSLGQRILEFFCEPARKWASEENRRILSINLALCYKWNDQEEASQKVVKGLDWSATSNRFGLAVAVLEDRFTDAARLMESSLREEAVVRDHFDEWPLFKAFRKTDEYKAAYRALFSEDPPENEQRRGLQLTAEDFDIAEADMAEEEPGPGAADGETGDRGRAAMPEGAE